MESGEVLLRVERGQADEAELAALTAVLIALCAGGREVPEEPSADGFRWWRQPDAYTAPDSWR